LDAHPDIVVGHERDVLYFAHAGFGRAQIYSLLLKSSEDFAKKGLRKIGYAYSVPDQWQGRFRHIKAIGDKHGEATTLRLKACPWLLRRAHRLMGSDLKFIHVVRNPYDNIRTIALKTKRDGNSLDLRHSIDYYFSLCQTITETKRRIAMENLFEFRHEIFVQNPKILLEKLCHFLRVDTPENYLRDCSDIVFKSHRKTRFEVNWSDDLIDRVRLGIDRFPFLKGYAFQERF